jgi:4-amino-4-deoxy-L-arabinose transferase-like glycosyltransferase
LNLALSRHGLAIFAAALLLRLGALAVFPGQTVLDSDQVEYDRIAHNIATGRGFSLNPGVETSVRAPGYPYFAAGLYKLFGHNYTAVRIVQAVLGAVTAWLLFWIASAAFDDRVGKAAGWLCAAYAVFIHYEARVQSEALMLFLVVASAPGLLSYIRTRRLWPLAVSALLMGAATLTRPGTLLFPLAAAPLLALRRPPDWKGPVLYLAVFAAVLLPWKYRNHNLFDHWTLCSRGPGFGLYVTGLMTQGVPYEEGYLRYAALMRDERYREPTEPVRGSHPYMELETRMQREGKAAIRARPFLYLWIVVKRFPRFWITSHSSVFGVADSLGNYRRAGRWGPIAFRLSLLGFHAALWALALYGLYRRRSAIAEIWPLLLIPAYFTIHILFDIIPRYHLPALPFVFAFAAAGASALADRWNGRAQES